MSDSIDWRAFAEAQGLLANGGETAGTFPAWKMLEQLVGDEAWRDAVDYAVSAQPGHLLAGSVLQLVGPQAAITRCYEIFRNPVCEDDDYWAVVLLKSMSAKKAAQWLPEFLASANQNIRRVALGIVEDLMFQGEIAFEEAIRRVEPMRDDPDLKNAAEELMQTARRDARLDFRREGPDYVLLMHADATSPVAESDWPAYFDTIDEEGYFAGGSAIGPGATYRKSGEPGPVAGQLSGLVRVHADTLEEAAGLLAGNPVYEAGGTVEIRELPRDQAGSRFLLAR